MPHKVSVIAALLERLSAPNIRILAGFLSCWFATVAVPVQTGLLPLRTFFNSVRGDWQGSAVLVTNAGFSVHVCHPHRGYTSEKRRGSYSRLMFDLAEPDEICAAEQIPCCCRGPTSARFQLLGGSIVCWGVRWKSLCFLTHFPVACDPLPVPWLPARGCWGPCHGTTHLPS